MENTRDDMGKVECWYSRLVSKDFELVGRGILKAEVRKIGQRKADFPRQIET